MGKNQHPPFVMMPLKLFRLGLDPFELAAYAVLAKHGDKNGRDIFPKLETLMAESGMGRMRLWKSLNGLRALGVIEWDTGGRGRSNRYRIRAQGLWSTRSGLYSDTDSVRVADSERPRGDVKSTPDGRHLDPVPRSMNYSAEADEDEIPKTPEQRAQFFKTMHARILSGIAERSE